MNHEQRLKIGEIWIGLSAMYGKEINKISLKLMLDAIDDLDFVKVEESLNQWAKTSKAGRHPFPAEIRERIYPTMSLDGQANEIASRIRQAISKHGWCNLRAAKDEIGEIGWEIVTRLGGWLYVCENYGVDLNPLTFHAQSRDLAKSLIEANKNSIGEHMAINDGNSNIIKTLEFKIKEIPK